MAKKRAPRGTLDRERVISGARDYLDKNGHVGLTMRGLAESLGVRPMALYHHIVTKDDLLDEVVDSVFSDIYLPDVSGDWKDELAKRSRSVRIVLSSHPWALSLMETRKKPGINNMRQHEAVLEILRSSDFSLPAASHGYAVLDAFVYGFILQEIMLGTVGLEDDTEVLAAGIDFSATPRIAELVQLYLDADKYPFVDSFEVGLELVLNGLEALRTRFPEPRIN